MITEMLAEIAFNLAGWFAALWPEWDIPAWVTDSRGAMIALLETYTGLGVWVDWTILGYCLTAVAFAFAIGLTIRLLRAILAHVPQVGGGGA